MSDRDEPAERTAQRASPPASPASSASKSGPQFERGGVDAADRLCLPVAVGCDWPPLFPRQASGSLVTREELSSFGTHRAGILAAGIFSIAAIGGGQRLRWNFVGRDQPWPQQSQAEERRNGFRRHPATGRGIPRAQRSGADAPIPIDAVTRSASGLDPTSPLPMRRCKLRGWRVRAA